MTGAPRDLHRVNRSGCEERDTCVHYHAGGEALVLPTALRLRLFRVHWNYTVLLDDHSVGKIGNEQVRVFSVDPGEHRLRLRFVLLRRSKETRVSLKEDEEREFLCGTTGFGWPTLRKVSPGGVAEIRRTSEK